MGKKLSWEMPHLRNRVCLSEAAAFVRLGYKSKADLKGPHDKANRVLSHVLLLKKTRELDLSQTQLAELVGRDETSLWLAGKEIPDRLSAHLLCKAFGTKHYFPPPDEIDAYIYAKEFLRRYLESVDFCRGNDSFHIFLKTLMYVDYREIMALWSRPSRKTLRELAAEIYDALAQHPVYGDEVRFTFQNSQAVEMDLESFVGKRALARAEEKTQPLSWDDRNEMLKHLHTSNLFGDEANDRYPDDQSLVVLFNKHGIQTR
jgi:hypothetical protein